MKNRSSWPKQTCMTLMLALLSCSSLASAGWPWPSKENIVGKGFDLRDADLWNMKDLTGHKVFDDFPQSCIKQVDCPHSAGTVYETFASIKEWSEYFSKSLGIEVGGTFHGVKASISASTGIKDTAGWLEARHSVYIRASNSKACYMITDDCLYSSPMDSLNTIVKSLSTGKDDPETMDQWDQIFIGRFGTHLAVASSHGAAVKSLSVLDLSCKTSNACMVKRVCLNLGFFSIFASICKETSDCKDAKQCDSHYTDTCTINGGSSSYSAQNMCAHKVDSWKAKSFMNSGDLKAGSSIIDMKFERLDNILARNGHIEEAKALGNAIDYHNCDVPYAWKPTKSGGHSCQCNLTCKNGGTLDSKTCTCKCVGDEAHGWKGFDCGETYGKCIAAPGARRNDWACKDGNHCLSTKDHLTCKDTEVCCNKTIHAKCCPFGSSCHCAPSQCYCVNGHGTLLEALPPSEQATDINSAAVNFIEGMLSDVPPMEVTQSLDLI